ncbi:hypothetical protein RFI_27463 [Reticulomyxa filosa]|uniref:Uncharacterized protein n=1 Tax=Reticulomyxa filosa TaxID=46433 RepID=X6M7F9_RETFI|nr:hypothetical protein RFI_27463 [Reticulomyxa filosa]|eukprot:ETO09908.1 hypothetical protein RFI_27463 [Reticulomyxa filosa]
MIKDKKNIRRKRTQTLAFVSGTSYNVEDIPPPPPQEPDESPVAEPMENAPSMTKPSTNGPQSWDPKQQGTFSCVHIYANDFCTHDERERERGLSFLYSPFCLPSVHSIKKKKRSRTRKSSVQSQIIEELEIKFKEFEMRLDRCLAKQCLRVQKHRQVIQVYQTQTQIHQLEENEDTSRYEKKDDANAHMTSEQDNLGSDSDSGNKNESSKKHSDNKDTASNVSVIESKIAVEEQTIEKISLEKEYEKYQKKIALLKDWINSL